MPLSSRTPQPVPETGVQPRRPWQPRRPLLEPALSPAARRAAARIAARERHDAELARIDRLHRQHGSTAALIRPWRWQRGVHARRRFLALLLIVAAAWAGLSRADGVAVAAHQTRLLAMRAAHAARHDATQVNHHAARAVTSAVRVVTPRRGSVPLIRGGIRDVRIPAPSLHGSSDALVLLPKGYTTAHRYPVLYLLHGQPDTPEHAVGLIGGTHGLDQDIAAGTLAPTIVVVPRGASDPAQDIEWSNAGGGGAQWGSFVSHDLVSYVDHHYATEADPAHRAVAGISMGGYGAVNLALRHPDVFGTASSWSGYFDATSQTAGGAPGSAGWKSASPMQYLPTVATDAKAHGLAISLYAGSEDPFVGQNRTFGQALASAGITHRFRVVDGAHDDAVWRANASSELSWIDARLRSASAPT